MDAVFQWRLVDQTSTLYKDANFPPKKSSFKNRHYIQTQDIILNIQTQSITMSESNFPYKQRRLENDLIVIEPFDVRTCFLDSIQNAVPEYANSNTTIQLRSQKST